MIAAQSRRLLAGFCFCAAVITGLASAAPFTPGNLVVYRVGTGATALSANGSPVFLDEYTPAGALVQSIAMPTVGNIPLQQKALLASGTATSDGLLTRSADGTCLAVPGYGRDLGTGSGNLVSGTLAVTGNPPVPRVVARVSANASIDVSTSVSDSATGTNFRGAASNDCSAFWISGNAGGVRYAPLGATSSVDLTTAAPTSLNTERGIAIFGGQLYVASPSNVVNGIAAIGSALPTFGTQTLTKLNGTALATSPYSFFLADLDAGVAGYDTLYIVDDAVGLMKFALVGGTWTPSGTIGSGADTYRGLTATVSGNTVTLYATRKGVAAAGGGGDLVKLVDASGYNGTLAGTPIVLVTAASNSNIALRGVALAPGVVTITPSAGPNGSISPATPQVVPGGVARAFTVIANAGSTASATGCGGTLVGTTYTTALATANCSVVATFAQITHTVTPSAGPHGAITPSSPQVVAQGGTTTFNVAPDPGYSASAVGCGGALSGNTYTTGATDADCTVLASFTLITYTVTPSAEGNGTITPSAVQTVLQGMKATFTVSPQFGYFAMMGGSCDGTLTGSSYTTKPVMADCNVTATFVPLPRYTVTPTATANGTLTPFEPQTVISGQTATFTFAAAPGYSTAVRGSCGGSLAGNTFTTKPVLGNCTVRFTFAKKLVLFVGNSYTFGRVDPVMSYNTASVTDLTYEMWLANADGSNEDEPHPWGGIPGVFKKLTDQAGLDYDVSISARNAASLRGHYLNTNPAGWDLRGNVASQRWDAVVLQDLSDEPLPDGRGANANLTFFNVYVDKFEKWIHVGAAETYTELELFGGSATPRVISPANANANPSAEIFLYQTWARPDMIGPNGTNHPDPDDPLSFYYTETEGLETMTADFHDAYFGRAAANPNIEDVSPVGDAFLRAVQEGIAMRDPYVPETGKINLWHTDYFHPSKYGSYLSALVHFARITGINPMTLGAGEQAAADLGIDPAVAAQLQRVARATVMPDTIAPTTSATSSPSANAAGWNKGSVTVTFAATDNADGWGVSAVNYASSGAQTGAGSVASGGTLTIAAEGVTTVTYYATDQAGNAEAPRTLRIAIDSSAPVIAGLPGPECNLWPPNHKMVQVATISAGGGTSPLASFNVAVSSNEPAAPGESDIAITGSGATRTVALRAERDGKGMGRIYTFTVSALDEAGNASAASATCKVPHDKGR
jgi:hypothetical protein